MMFNGKSSLLGINNYLDLANHPEVRKIDAEAAAEWVSFINGCQAHDQLRPICIYS